MRCVSELDKLLKHNHKMATSKVSNYPPVLEMARWTIPTYVAVFIDNYCRRDLTGREIEQIAVFFEDVRQQNLSRLNVSLARKSELGKQNDSTGSDTLATCKRIEEFLLSVAERRRGSQIEKT